MPATTSRLSNLLRRLLLETTVEAAQRNMELRIRLLAATVAAIIAIESGAKLWLLWRRRQRQRCSMPSAAVEAEAAKAAAAAAEAQDIPTPKQPPTPVIDISASAVAASAHAPAPPPVLKREPAPRVTILTALDLTPALLAELEAQLVRNRNRFICMQYCTMAREAAAAAAQAAAGGDAAGLARSRELRFALLREEAKSAGDSAAFVAGALFYPRSVAAPSQEPHVYVDLLVCAAPGRGHGGALLAAVEAHVAGSPAAFGHATHLRLLSVESARPFWERCGFGAPDERKESIKPLLGSGAITVAARGTDGSDGSDQASF